MRVLEHEGDAVGWVAGIHRYVRAARLLYGEDRDHHVERALHRDPDAHVTADPEAAQVSRELVRALVELAVRERDVLEDHSRRVRGPRYLADERLVDAEVALEGYARVVPRTQHLLAFGGR